MVDDKISLLAIERYEKFRTTYETNLAEFTPILMAVSNNWKFELNILSNLVLSCIASLERISDVFLFLQYMPDSKNYVFSHSFNSAIISYAIGSTLKWDYHELDKLVVAALLHDVGMLHVEDAILNKTTPLTNSERDKLTWHTFQGYQLLQAYNISEDIRMVALTHHKKLDGSGYPADVNPQHLNNYTKVITIADMYGAMTSKRVYRSAISPFEVLGEFQNQGFHKLDPSFMLPYLQFVSNSYIGADVVLNNGQIATVVMANPVKLACPLIKCGDNFINLAENSDIKIVRMV